VNSLDERAAFRSGSPRCQNVNLMTQAYQSAANFNNSPFRPASAGVVRSPVGEPQKLQFANGMRVSLPSSL